MSSGGSRGEGSSSVWDILKGRSGGQKRKAEGEVWQERHDKRVAREDGGTDAEVGGATVMRVTRSGKVRRYVGYGLKTLKAAKPIVLQADERSCAMCISIAEIIKRRCAPQRVYQLNALERAIDQKKDRDKKNGARTIAKTLTIWLSLDREAFDRNDAGYQVSGDS